MLNTHIQMSACRAIQKAAKSRVPNTTAQYMIKKSDAVFAFYKSTNKSVDVEWITATVVEPKECFVECRSSQKGRPMRVAYEHIRLVPSNEIAKEITQNLLEDYMAETDPKDIKTIEQMTDDDRYLYEDVFGTDSDIEKEEV